MGTTYGKQFQVHMYEEDIQMMKDLVKLHPAKETGGNLFGLWNNDEEPVLHVVLGPAVGCARTEVSFYQSIPYLERVGRLLTEQFLLCHIGEWHSHHKLRLSEPSSGDSSTVIRNFPRGARGFILIIANILPSGKVTLSPYLYRQGQTTYEKGEISQLGSSCSPFRKIGVINEYIKKDEDWSTSAHEHMSTPQYRRVETSPDKETHERKACAYMFEHDKQMIENRLSLSDGYKMEGELLGLWTSHDMPVLHVVVEPKKKNGKELQPLSPLKQPIATMQTRDNLASGYPLENIGKYILNSGETATHEPSEEDLCGMRREYPGRGLLVQVHKVQDKVVAFHPYLTKKKSCEPLEMEFLQSRKVFTHAMSDESKEEERKLKKIGVDDPLARSSPTFEQHKQFFPK